MKKYVAYKINNVLNVYPIKTSLGICHNNLTPEHYASLIVPKGTKFYILDEDETLRTNSYRDAWELNANNTKIIINQKKALEIAKNTANKQLDYMLTKAESFNKQKIYKPFIDKSRITLNAMNDLSAIESIITHFTFILKNYKFDAAKK